MFSASVPKLDEDEVCANDGSNERKPTTSITSFSFRDGSLSES